MASEAKRVIFMQEGRWHWELVVGGVTVARGRGSGYATRAECRTVADMVVGGFFRDADRRIRDPRR